MLIKPPHMPRFFKSMDVKQTISDTVEKVEEAVGLKPEEKKDEEIADEPITESAEPIEDRSAYNCPDCGGEGLKKDVFGNLIDCPLCHNTGKI